MKCDHKHTLEVRDYYKDREWFNELKTFCGECQAQIQLNTMEIIEGTQRVPELSDTVQKFAAAMQHKLNVHASKGLSGWRDAFPLWLYRQMKTEIKEFDEAIIAYGFSANAEENKICAETVLSEAADVANYLMMICDVLKCFEEGENEPVQQETGRPDGEEDEADRVRASRGHVEKDCP